MSISLGNYKEWLPFAFIIAGVAIALIAPLLSRGNQRYQKTQDLLATFRSSLHAHDMEHWKEIYLGTREGSLAPPGHFMSRLGKPVPLESMWTAGSDDHTAIQRMAECMEKACSEMLTHTIDNKTMWFEVGQLMEAMHAWLENIPGVQRELTFLEEQYPAIKKVFDKYGHSFRKWPYKMYIKR